MSSSSHNTAYVPGPTFGFMKLLASSGSHCTKWADEQHRPAGFESRLIPDLPLPFIPTLIGLRAFDLVSSRVWWEAATNSPHQFNISSIESLCMVGWGCRMYQLLLCRVVRPPNKCPGYDTKQSYGEAPVCWIFRECRVPLYCHHSQIHSGPEW